MLGALFTILANGVRGIARIFGYELKIVLTEHKIKTKFDNPSREGNCWDSTHWTKGNIFLKGIANPIKPKKTEVEDGDWDLITSERYKTFMEQSLIDDMLQASKSDGLTLKTAVIALASLQILNLVGLYFISNGGI